MTPFIQIMIIVFVFLLVMGCSDHPVNDHPVEVVNVNAIQTFSGWNLQTSFPCDYCHINMTESVCYNCTEELHTDGGGMMCEKCEEILIVPEDGEAYWCMECSIEDIMRTNGGE